MQYIPQLKISNVAYILTTFFVVAQSVAINRLVLNVSSAKDYNLFSNAIVIGMIFKSIIGIALVYIPFAILSKLKSRQVLDLSKHNLKNLSIRGFFHVGSVFVFFFIMGESGLVPIMVTSYLTPIGVSIISKFYLKHPISNKVFIWIPVVIFGASCIVRFLSIDIVLNDHNHYILKFNVNELNLRSVLWSLCFVGYYTIASLIVYSKDKSNKIIDTFLFDSLATFIWVGLFVWLNCVFYNHTLGEYLSKLINKYVVMAACVVCVGEILIFFASMIGNKFSKNPIESHTIDFSKLFWSLCLSYIIMNRPISLMDIVGSCVMIFGMYKIILLVYGNSKKA